MKSSTARFTSILTIIATIGLSLLLVSIPSERLLEIIGTENGYLFMYLIAFVGSISTFASIPYPLFLISFATGGFNPLFLGLVSALGVVTADSVTFFAARKGGGLLGQKLQESIHAFSAHIRNHPRLVTPGLVLYGTFAPLSNDFAVISLSLMRYRFFQVILPLAVGNLVYNIGIAYLGMYAYNWIIGIL